MPEIDRSEQMLSYNSRKNKKIGARQLEITCSRFL